LNRLVWPYLQVDEDADASDEEEDNAAYLSDQEQLDDIESSPRFLDSLRRGMPPPETSVLFALCMIHEGGRNFLAKRFLESINLLEQETIALLKGDVGTVESSGDPLWQQFRSIVTEPLGGRIAAYAYVADNLRQSNKEAEFSSYLSPLFGRLVHELQKEGFTQELLTTTTVSSSATKKRRNQVLKVILAWGRLQIHNAVKADGQPNKSSSSVSQGLKLMKECLNISESQALYLEADGSISDLCVEVRAYLRIELLDLFCGATFLTFTFFVSPGLQVLSIFARGYSMLSKQYADIQENSFLEDLTYECGSVVSWLCASRIPDNNEDGRELLDLFDLTAGEWSCFPLQSSWQLLRHKALSLRCYNLCVAFNVSHFSGWESNEFCLSLMKSRASCTYFGLQVHDGKVAGFLPASIESELAQQWQSMATLVRVAATFDFSKRLAKAKELPWYQNGVDEFIEASTQHSIAANGELEGLRILLAYSSSCLQLAMRMKIIRRQQLIMTALSILLPIVSPQHECFLTVRREFSHSHLNCLICLLAFRLNFASTKRFGHQN
jgi:hypothetical protein